MTSLSKEYLCLLELLKASLFSSSPKVPEDVNWERVFDIAKGQCIVSLVASYVPLSYKNEWLVVASQSKAHFMQLLYEQNSLVNLFKENHIKFVILKGTSAAIYYPNPSLRTFGDIDIYVSNKQLDSVRNILEHNGFNFVLNTDRHYTYSKNSIEFELHNSFGSYLYNDIDRVILDGLNDSVNYSISNYTFPGLPIYVNGLTLLSHIMQHLHDTGIGFRQIIDWMMFVNEVLDDYTWEDHFKKLATEFKLDKLAVTVTYMCKKWFGLPKVISWCDNANEEVADQLLFRLIEDGNFGCCRAPFEEVKKAIRKEGFFKHLQRAGMENWHLAQNHCLFRPFAWLYQFCRYVLKGVARLITGKKVFINENHNMSIEELLKRLA